MLASEFIGDTEIVLGMRITPLRNKHVAREGDSYVVEDSRSGAVSYLASSGYLVF